MKQLTIKLKIIYLNIKHKIFRSVSDRKSIFSEIYRDNYWGSPESVSGVGSQISYTENLRFKLNELIKNYDIETVCDAPCGDFNWIGEIVTENNLKYIGYDIVGKLVTQNNEKFGNKNIKFEVADICVDVLAPCDLLIVRDVLFHLSNADLVQFKSILLKTDFKYLLVSHHSHTVSENIDINTGDFRELDIGMAPLHFPIETALIMIEDSPPWYPISRRMLLFEKSQLT